MKLLQILSEKLNKDYYVSLLVRDMDYDESEAKEMLDSIINNVKTLPDPIKLYRIIRVDDKNDINLEKPGSHYAKNRKDLMNSHSFAEGVGDNSYIITVLAPKSLIDIKETVFNNVLYPHENEVTLKNKGKGVEIVSIKKIKD
jgi:hypothetical protein